MSLEDEVNGRLAAVGHSIRTFRQAHPMSAREAERRQGFDSVSYEAGWNAGFTAGRASALPPVTQPRAHWEACTGRNGQCGDINIHDVHWMRVDD